MNSPTNSFFSLLKNKIKLHLIRHKVYYIYTLIITILLVSLSILSRKSTAFSEWYSTHIYRAIQEVISRITGIFPFSLFELLICGFIIFIIAIIVLTIKLIIQKKGRKLIKLYAFLFSATLTVLLIFMLNCGINYHRLPFSAYSGLTVEKNSTTKLVELCEFLIEKANNSVPYIDIEDNEDYGFLFTLNNTNGQAEAVKAMNKLGEIYPALSGYYPKPKPVISSIIMSYEFITGVYSAFTVEANYNNHVADYTIPHTMCHELSHLRGFMREDEAEFIAYLACIVSDNANFNYSGYVNALTHVLNSVYSNCDKDVYIQLYSKLNPQIVRDYNYNNRYWDKFETPVAEIADAVNNIYLQANAQTDGVKSYGRMVDLLLAYYSDVLK